MSISILVIIVSLNHCTSVNGVFGTRHWRSLWLIWSMGPVVGKLGLVCAQSTMLAS